MTNPMIDSPAGSRRIGVEKMVKVSSLEPMWDGLIDDDVMAIFGSDDDGACVLYGDIINAQLIKTIKELTDEIRELRKQKESN